MPHAIWRGTISFGLVTIPVSLMPAEQPRELAFHLLDGRDMSAVHNRRVNEAGSEVPWENVVKGFEVSEGRWVVVTDDDLRAANVEATQTIDVLAAVCADEIDPKYFDKPYYLQPEKAGRKAYALLREALKREKRVALAKVVVRTRQHLAALVPDGDVLLLEMLRYPYELRDATSLDLPGSDLADSGVTDAEIALAGQLVATIAKPFEPDAPEYRDTYRDDLLALIAAKAEGVAAAAPASTAEAPAGGEVVDIVALLKRSLDDARRAQG
ncbi:MAG: Ku protein [Coriobacteriia bacterium]|nr:Ku protein [Coriobacteriia bacterium]